MINKVRVACLGLVFSFCLGLLGCWAAGLVAWSAVFRLPSSVFRLHSLDRLRAPFAYVGCGANTKTTVHSVLLAFCWSHAKRQPDLNRTSPTLCGALLSGLARLVLLLFCRTVMMGCGASGTTPPRRCLRCWSKGTMTLTCFSAVFRVQRAAACDLNCTLIVALRAILLVGTSDTASMLTRFGMVPAGQSGRSRVQWHQPPPPVKV